jgi:hypothetical protein
MGDLINLNDRKKKKEQHTAAPIAKPSEIASVETVDFMRQKMYSMSEESRNQFMFIVLTNLIKWIIKSGYYDKPGTMILAWAEKKINEYSSTEKVGK